MTNLGDVLRRQHGHPVPAELLLDIGERTDTNEDKGPAGHELMREVGQSYVI